MIDFLMGLPLWVLAVGLNVWLMGFTLIALGVLRRWVFPRVRITGDPALYFSIAVMQAGFVLFSLIAALTAVAVWARYEVVAGIVSDEATTIAGLYRDFGGYPQSKRDEARETLKAYTHQIIYEAFPAHREGRYITRGSDLLDKLQEQLFAFEPATKGQEVVHGETLAQYNRLVQARRQRLDAVTTGLPIVIWWAILPGAMGCLVLSLFVPVEDTRHHVVLSALLAGFVAMVLFIVIALDRPFRGAMAITPAPYQLVYDQLMSAKRP